MEAPIQALENMKVPFDHVFICDICPKAQQTIDANWKPDKFYCDITTRDNSISPEVDVYVIGFPCQLHSKAGKQQGFKDEKGLGPIFESVLDYTARTLPKVFILENVDGLVTIDNGKCLEKILKALKQL